MHWAKQKKILISGGNAMLEYATRFPNQDNTREQYQIWAGTLLEAEGFKLMKMDEVREIGGDNLIMKYVSKSSMATFDVTLIEHMKGQLYRVHYDGGFESINEKSDYVYAIPKAGESSESPDSD